MVTRAVSQAVLAGMRKSGLSDERICSIAKLSREKFKMILQRRAALTEKQLTLIEEGTGKAAIQFLALIVPDRRTAKLFSQMGEFRMELAQELRERAVHSA